MEEYLGTKMLRGSKWKDVGHQTTRWAHQQVRFSHQMSHSHWLMPRGNDRILVAGNGG